MTSRFCHLHTHTEYSMLDCISPIPRLVARAKELDMDALAVTDHGAMYGVVDFYSECHDQGIKPILGCEVYVAHQRHTDRGTSERSPHHLTLLCQDNTGYRNLVQLVTAAHLDGFYHRPRIDLDLLASHASGLICLSGCPSAHLPRILAQNPDPDAAAAVADRYRQIFDNRYWLEIQRHRNVPNLDAINERLVQLSERTGIPLVATNDSHYLHREQHQVHDVYLAIQTNATIGQSDRLRMDDDSYYLKSAPEMADLFPDLPAALDNSLLIAQDCNVELDFGRKRLPYFETPDGLDSDQYLARLCEDGFRRLCPADDDRYRKRLDYELEVIRQTRFADYFLIVWDIIRFAHQQGIRFGVRGSAAASLALYCLDITVADPIRHRLVFERFLNLERKEMPDIDMDFQDDRRDEVTNYVVAKYDSAHVGQIVTFSRFGVKSAIKAVGKAMGLTYQAGDRIARAAPIKSPTIAHALENGSELRRLAEQDPNTATLLQHAQELEGIVHHTGSHAAGVVISSEPLTEVTPLQPPTDQKDTPAGQSVLNLTQYSMDPIAKLGLLKMDFLGLTSLTILDQVMYLTEGGPQQLADIPLDDAETYRLLGSGNTTNVFQLESDGMQRYIRDLKPSNLGDISAMIALYRPGPMDNIDRFIKSKHGLERISYPHPSMKELLDETYGVIVYQDQVLHILQSFAGYTMGEADIVRKAMGKKIPELMGKERQRFVAMSQQQGHAEATASQIFDIIEPFAGYAFNKAHSISYALICYWSAWYKTHHPAAYMTACLNCRQTQNKAAYRAAIAECRRIRLALETPCINRSAVRSRPQDDNRIRLGLSAIQGIGEAVVTPIVTGREQNGEYADLADFCQRAPRLTVKQMESLIKAGALDCLADRGHLLENLNNIHTEITDHAVARNSGQMGMFGAGAADSPAPPWLSAPPETAPATPEQKAQMEAEALGIAVSQNPAAILESLAGPADVITTAKLADMTEGQEWTAATIAGFIQAVERRSTKDHKPFLTVTLALADGDIEAMVWSDVLADTEDYWQLHNVVRVSGRLTARTDGYSLSAETVQLLDNDSPDPAGNALVITISETDNPLADLVRLRQTARLLLEYPGTDAVLLNILPTGDRPAIKAEFDSLNSDAANRQLRNRLNALAGVSA